ncbi:hypothetical protein [Chitinophaga defluvii]|uniref:Uncharacterized protein n=1 Tax=Chitinophaga defluvii TaxID=3163343 RepID=A0ABV2TEZ6_9BACT
MKRILVLVTCFFPLILCAQTKLTQPQMDDFSDRAAHHFQIPNDSIMGFITDQMTRSGSGGLDVDKTMGELKKDPEALDAALKYLYQFSNCNRQRLIGNLRTMGIQNANVFPMATYIVNKYKGEAKELMEEKAAYVKLMPSPAPPAAAAPVASNNAAQPEAANTTSTANTAAPTQTAAVAPPPPPAPDPYNWDVRKIFSLHQPEKFIEMYGKENVITRQATDMEGNNIGQAYVVFPDSNNEMQVIFGGDSTTTVIFNKENAKWKSPFGIKVGDPLAKIVKINGKDFRINGFEWANGGSVDSWEGGAMDGKGVSITFKAMNTGDPKLYDPVTGDKKVKSDHSSMKKLDVVVEEISFKSN